MASIASISSNVTQINTQPELAEVTLVDAQQRIQQVNLSARNAHQSIAGQAKHISPANIGDTVLVQHTLQGIVVIAQIANQNDSPCAHITNNNGHVNVSGAKSVTLSTKKGTIEVHESGKITLDATEIDANSERDFTLAGWPIRLN